MSMPSGKRFKNGYATVEKNCLKYREIAEQMSISGDKMNHSTARNVFLSAMRKVCTPIYHEISRELNITEDEIFRNPDFQEGLIEIISDFYENQSVDV